MLRSMSAFKAPEHRARMWCRRVSWAAVHFRKTIRDAEQYKLKSFELCEFRDTRGISRCPRSLKMPCLVCEAGLGDEPPQGEGGYAESEEEGQRGEPSRPRPHWRLRQRRRDPLLFPFLT